ncbi:MAG: FAD-dependent oxidoreductase, partial [Gammaproteobacteria bacterium]
PRLLKALHLSLLRLGVDIQEHTEAQGFVVERGEVRGVETSRGRIPAERVVVAAGAWSGALLEKAGLRLPVVPIKGQMIMFRAVPGVVSRIVLQEARYVIPRRDGRVLVGSTVEQAGFDKAIDEQAGSALAERARELFPALRRYPIERQWAGLRPGNLPASRGGVPFIGEHPAIRGLYVITGHFRNGVVMAPASVHLLMDLMRDRPPWVDAKPYALTLEMV